MDLSSVSDQDKVGLNDGKDQKIGRWHTSAAPIHDCPRDKHFSSSTSGKYNESGMHAIIMQRRCKRKITSKNGRLLKCKPTLQIPHAALHSSLVAETWLAWQSMPLWEMNRPSVELPLVEMGRDKWAHKDPWYDSCRWRSYRRRCLWTTRWLARGPRNVATERIYPMPKEIRRSTSEKNNQ